MVHPEADAVRDLTAHVPPMGRRRFLALAGATALGVASREGTPAAPSPTGIQRGLTTPSDGTHGMGPDQRPPTVRSDGAPRDPTGPRRPSPLTLFLCGDVMTGRGIDQILPSPVDPRLFEAYVKDAREYVRLAEAAHGPIPRNAAFSYVWGDALAELDRARPDVRLINLETAVTTSDDRDPKAVSYRMHPRNFACITAADVDCCVLANNHVLDWGVRGLEETLETLERARVPWAGAGRGAAEAEAPAALTVPKKGRVLVFAWGAANSGIPRSWAATSTRPGVNVLTDFSQATVGHVASAVGQHRGEGDVVVASIHWGANWGYGVSADEVAFAHGLIDHAGVDIVHGHSSHHVKGLEVYGGKLILYGCGDFLTDYEGIGGHESFRGDIGAMYFPSVDPASGELTALYLVPTIMRRFRVERAPREDANWLRDLLGREGARWGTRAETQTDGTIAVRW